MIFDRMRRRILTFAVLCLFAVILFSNLTWANDQKVILDDEASLLTSSERDDLLQRAEELSEETGWDIMIVSTDNAGGKEAIEYIEDYYMDHFHQDDGVGCLIDMDNREIRIASSGMAIRYLVQSRVDDILDMAYYAVSEGEYAACFEAMLDGIEHAYKKGIPSGQANVYSDTGEIDVYHSPRRISLIEFLIAVGAGLLVMLIFCGVVFGKYRMKIGKYKYILRNNSGVDLRVKEDQLIRKHVTQRHIPKNPNPGGGGGFSGGGSHSTVHHGSGGHTFGGGGRKF